jgi:eukaryotic-like serine/threonine-protein kinase
MGSLATGELVACLLRAYIPASPLSVEPTDLRAHLQSALAMSYTLERELGRGGMATVFLAQDQKHKRPVALKVLHPELARTLGPERFRREIELVARLQHPHILTVHDSGDAGGQLWFTMPFVEGETLRGRLGREKQLPVEAALRIATETARALEYAHQHGVVHRDIKPENLLLTLDGSTLVADFGIARALAGGEARLTETGMAVGTPAYMSPEQAAGDHQVDARTDIYALGAVLYEMLAGEPPFTGPSAQAIIAKRFSGQVPRVRTVRPSVPDTVEQAIQRALAPVAGDRFASAADFARALAMSSTATPSTTSSGTSEATSTVRSATPALLRRRGLPSAASALVLGLLVGVGVLFASRRSHTDAVGSGGHVLAVLPFENLGDSADAYFADGITNEVRGKLSQIAGLAVIARASSNEYRRTTKTPQQIARELGADYLLTATVQWQKSPTGPSRVRVSPELVRVAEGSAPVTQWQQPFDASLTDVFAIQTDVATEVASALDVALGDRTRRALTAQPTASLGAYDAFLKGEAASQALAAVDPPSLRRAISFYEHAVALDSTFVSAWAQLGRAHAVLYFNGTPVQSEAVQARQAAERAQMLGPSRPDGPLALGDFYHNLLENGRALAAYEAGLRVAPNNVELLGGAGVSEMSLGRWEAALQHLRQAAALDPRSSGAARRVATVLLWLRRYPEAEVVADEALALAPANLTIIQRRVMIALAQGDLGGAKGVVDAALSAVEPATLFAFLADYNELYWALDEPQQQRLLTLPPSAFDDDRAVWALVRTQLYYIRGNLAQSRMYADSSRLDYDEHLRTAPNDGQQHVMRGLALAYLGRKAEAIEEGERGVKLWSISRDAYQGSYIQHQLARIYLLVGEPDKALDYLEPLLRSPYYLSPGWLRIDPTFAALRGNPRFERLARGN